MVSFFSLPSITDPLELPQSTTVTLRAPTANAASLMDNEKTAPRMSAQEHMRSALDEQIADLEERLRELKYKRNSLAAISQLPGELFSKIFAQYKTSSLQETLAWPYKAWDTRPFGWMKVAQVCHRWREIFLELKWLWSEINIGTSPNSKMSPGLIQMMLERSNPQPFSLSADLGRIAECTVLEDVASQAERIQALYLRGSLKGLYRLSRQFPPSAPLLRTLNVSLFKDLGLFGGQETEGSEVAQLFPQGAPQLERLTVFLTEGDSISWASSLFQALMSFSLTDSMIGEGSLDTLLDTLDNMLNLIDLALQLSNGSGEYKPHVRSRKVSLSGLKTFVLGGRPAVARVVLEHLYLPSLVSAALRLTYCTTITTEEFSSIMALLSHSPSSSLPGQHWKPSVLEYGSVHQGNGPEIRADFWATSKDKAPSFSLTLGQLKTGLQGDRLLLSLPWPLTSITSLILGDDSECVLSLASHLSSVRQITLLRSSSHLLFENMAPESSVENKIVGETPEIPYFPKLVDVMFDKVSFSEEPRLLEILRSWLALRLRLGYPIANIAFEGCKTSTNDWQEDLKEMVSGNVVWKD